MQIKRIWANCYLLVSAFFSYAIVALHYFPSLGFTLSFITLASLVLISKSKKSKDDWFWYFFIISFSLCLILRANTFLTLLNLVAISYLGSIFILGPVAHQGPAELIFSPLSAFFSALAAKAEFDFGNKFNKEKLVKLFASLAITWIVLVLIIPLLSFANPLFKNAVINVLSFFPLKELLQKLFTENAMMGLARLLVFLFSIFLLPRMLILAGKNKKFPPVKAITPPFSLLIPKLCTALVLVIFFITQLQLYFVGNATLQALNYSHSRYARETFAHLSIVSLIVFALLYYEWGKNKWSRFFSYILLLFALFLNLVGLKSDLDYVSAWGFTQKRLYGFSVIAWLMAMFGLYYDKSWRNLKQSLFVKNIIYLTSILLIIINLANFDYLIAHFARARTGEGIDYNYLSLLSTDSKSYKKNFLSLAGLVSATENPDYKLVSAARRLERKIKNLQNKYQNLDWQTFNLSEYLEYRKTKDINTDDYYTLLYVARGYIENPQFVRDGPFSGRVVNLEPFSQTASVPAVRIKEASPRPQVYNPAPSDLVKVKVLNLNPNLQSCNIKIYDSGNKLLSSQSLDDNGVFPHYFGKGNFVLILYRYTKKLDTNGEITQEVAKQIPYTVNDDSNLSIDFNSF